jgi:hypothetical protein
VFSNSLPLIRTIVTILGVVGILAVVVPGPVEAGAVVADLWNWHEIQDITAHDIEHTRQLEVEDETIQKRIDIKEALINDLIAGRATLADVCSEFHRLNEAREVYMYTLRRSYPDASDTEIIARNVINFTTDRIADPARRATMLAQLEREMVQMQTNKTPAR